MVLLKENLSLKDLVINKQDSIIKIQDNKISDYKLTINAYQQVDTAHVNITKSLNDKAEIYRKERNWYRIAAVVLLIVSIIK